MYTLPIQILYIKRHINTWSRLSERTAKVQTRRQLSKYSN